MWKTEEGSTGRLIQLCIGYFVFYVIFTVALKYMTGKPDLGFPGMSDPQFLVYSTIGGSVVCLGWVIVRRWYRLKSAGAIQVGPVRMPRELLYIIPSGICTAIVIPTTSLMYMLVRTVMVAIVIMRGSIIVVSRLVDLVQKRQGILKREVYWQEEVGVLLALAAVATQIFQKKEGKFEFLEQPEALAVLGAYLVGYAIRLYLMNYFKNTRPKGVPLDNKGFFAIEQIAASVTLVIASAVVFVGPGWFGWNQKPILAFHDAIAEPRGDWYWGAIAGATFGVVAFFSVFLFMFKGRSATFAGLVNRLTSLLMGTAATVIFWFGWRVEGSQPKNHDWVALGIILVAACFLSFAERRRVRELVAAHEIGKA